MHDLYSEEAKKFFELGPGQEPTTEQRAFIKLCLANHSYASRVSLVKAIERANNVNS